MRRILLLAPLALALPTAALASEISIDFGVCSTLCEVTFNGTITNGGSFHTSAFSDNSVGGTGGTWSYDIGTLTQVPISQNPFCSSFGSVGESCFTFLTGTVRIEGFPMFTSSLTNGSLALCRPCAGVPSFGEPDGTEVAIWRANVTKTLCPVCTGFTEFAVGFAGGKPDVGGFVELTTTPEPSALEGLLLGGGLLGLAEVARRKLQVRT